MEVEHRLCRALLRIDQIQLVVHHARRERAQAAIGRDQLDLHRPGRPRRTADDDRLGDLTAREIPHPDAAAAVRRVAPVHVERAQGTDEVAGDHGGSFTVLSLVRGTSRVHPRGRLSGARHFSGCTVLTKQM